jgi:hypothetical protein
MSSGAGKITHTSDLTSVKYLAAVKPRLREKYVLRCVFIHFSIMFSIMGTTFSKLERLIPFNIIQQFLKVFLVQPLMVFAKAK